MLCASAFTNSPPSSAFFGVDRKKVGPHGRAKKTGDVRRTPIDAEFFPELPKLSRFFYGIESELDRMWLACRVDNAPSLL
jgi:hypothetical protein